jgi:hypothetical protein
MQHGHSNRPPHLSLHPSQHNRPPPSSLHPIQQEMPMKMETETLKGRLPSLLCAITGLFPIPYFWISVYIQFSNPEF